MKPARDEAHRLSKGIVPACVVGDDACEHSNHCNTLTVAIEARDEEWAERERVAFGADPKGGRE